jgi:hypothetical protein
LASERANTPKKEELIMSIATVSWHRNRESGEWEARKGGEIVATAYVRDGVSTGYWGRYRCRIRGSELHYATTLAEIKKVVSRLHETRLLDSGSLS